MKYSNCPAAGQGKRVTTLPLKRRKAPPSPWAGGASSRARARARARAKYGAKLFFLNCSVLRGSAPIFNVVLPSKQFELHFSKGELEFQQRGGIVLVAFSVRTIREFYPKISDKPMFNDKPRPRRFWDKAPKNDAKTTI